MKVLVVDFPDLAESLELVRGDWKSLANGDMTIATAMSDDLADNAVQEGDVIIAPGWFLSYLGERGLAAELPEEIATKMQPRLETLTQSKDLARGDVSATSTRPNVEDVSQGIYRWNDLYPLLRKQCAVWRDQVVAAPLGESIPILIYRKDLFSAARLDPPSDWAAYDAASKKLNAPEGTQKWSPVLEPLAPGSAGLQLLVRAAAYAKHPDFFTTLFEESELKARIDSPPFIRALEELRAASLDWSVCKQIDFAGVSAAILRGEAAMGIGWFAPSSASASEPVASSVELGFAPLPGSRDVYLASLQRWEKRQRDASLHVTVIPATGPVATISTKAQDGSAAARFIAWLGAPGGKWGLATQSGGPARYSQSDTAELPLAIPAGLRVPMLSAVERSMENEQALFAPRMQGRRLYMAALDDAVAAVFDGRQSPQEALKTAAGRWDEINRDFGIEKQKAAYEHGVRFRSR